MLDTNSDAALLSVRFLLPLRERMIARRADVETAAKAAGREAPSDNANYFNLPSKN